MTTPQPTTPPQQQEIPDFVPLCKTADLRDGEGRMYRPAAGRFRGKPMAVFSEGGSLYIVNYVCPHMGGPLSEGKIQDGVVECPWHSWAFNADSGKTAGTGSHSIAAYELRIEGDGVLVGGLKPASAS